MAYFKCKGEAGENIEYLYKWDFTKSLTDEVQGKVATLSGGATRGSDGVTLVSNTSNVLLPGTQSNPILNVGNTIEIVFGDVQKMFDDVHGRLLMKTTGVDGFICRYKYYFWNWEVYDGKWKSYETTSSDPDVFSNKTVKMNIVSENILEIYADDVLIYRGGTFFIYDDITDMVIGSDKQSFCQATIKSLRVIQNL